MNDKDDIRNNNNNDSRTSMMDVDQGSVKLPVPPPPPPPMLPRPISNDERGKNLLSHHLAHILVLRECTFRYLVISSNNCR